jgi:hypothetical protein
MISWERVNGYSLRLSTNRPETVRNVHHIGGVLYGRFAPLSGKPSPHSAPLMEDQDEWDQKVTELM